MHVKCKKKVIPVILGAAGTIKIIQKIPEQDTEKSRNAGNTEYSHGGHCTHA
jgi:RNase P/RNase MRP subunit POP5